MLFTYTFGEKLDLEKFEKQATHYISNMRETSYHIYFPHYKMTIETAGLDNSTAKIITVFICDIKRDTDGEVIDESSVFPLLDNRFKDSSGIQSIFTVSDNYRGSFTTSNVAEGIKNICQVIKLLHKLDHLKAFL